MKNLAVIPARSGSKGLVDKNIKMLNGKPLLAFTIEAAKKSRLFDEIFVSTDSKKYVEIAKEWGASVPFLRGQNLATDTASSWDVVKDAIKKYQAIEKEYDTVALLQPTSPLRTAEDIKAGYNRMKEKDANIVVAVCEVEHSLLWVNTLPEDFAFSNFINQNLIDKPRQCLPTFYRVNGALYIVKTNYLLMTDNIYADKIFTIVMPKEHSVDIDDEMDYIIAAALLNRQYSHIKK